MNAAAIDLCMETPELLRNRSKLLELARKKVADDGYSFRKGKSISKVYGETSAETHTPKRPKLDAAMRDGE